MGNRKSTVVMMAGLPGAGKTTLAYALRERLEWEVVDKDRLRIQLIELGQDRESAANQAYEHSFTEIRRALEEDHVSVIFDTAALHSSIVDTVKEIVASVENVQLKVILCVIDRDERNFRLRERVEKKQELYTRDTVEPATIADYLQYFDHLPKEKCIIFTNESHEKCLEKAIEFIFY